MIDARTSVILTEVNGIAGGREDSLSREEQLDQSGLRETEDRRATNRLGFDESARAQARKVLRNGRLGKTKSLNQINHSRRSGGQAPHDGEPGRIRERPEEGGGRRKLDTLGTRS